MTYNNNLKSLFVFIIFISFSVVEVLRGGGGGINMEHPTNIVMLYDKLILTYLIQAYDFSNRELKTNYGL